MQEIYTLSFSAVRGRPRRNSNEIRFSSKLGLSLGCIHFALGLLSVIFGVVGLIAEFHANKLGSALWCGLVFQGAGAAGIVASRKWYRRSYVRAFCLVSLVSALVALLLFALTCVGIASHYENYSATGGVNVANYVAKVSANLIVLSILEAILSLVSAAVAARAIRWRHVPPSERPKRAMIVRETFIVGGNVGSGTSGAEFGAPVTQIMVPDVILDAPDTLVAVHRMMHNREGQLHLRPAAIANRPESQVLDPNSLHDSWDSEESDTNDYDFPEDVAVEPRVSSARLQTDN